MVLNFDLKHNTLMTTLLKITWIVSLFFILVLKVSSQSVGDLNKQGKEYFEKGMYLEAENTLNQALKMQQNDSIDYASTINELAKLYAKQSKYAESENLYRNALQIRKTKIGDTSLEYAESLNGLGEVLFEINLYTDAEKLFKESLQIRKKLLGENHPDYAESLHNLGGLYLISGDMKKKPEEMIQKAADIRLNTLGKNHYKYANSLILLGLYYNSKGDFETAEKYYIQAIDINKQALGISHPGYISSVITLPSLYLTQGKYEEAKLLLIDILPIIESVYGKAHPKYAVNLNNLGLTYFYQGFYYQAEPILKEAMSLMKVVFGEEHTTYFNILTNLAILYQETGYYEQSEKCLNYSLRLCKKIYGDSHLQVSEITTQLGNLYFKLKNYDESEKFLQSSLDILRLNAESPLDSLYVLHTMAHIYAIKGETDKALNLFTDISLTQKKYLGENHPDYFRTISNIIDTKGNDPKVDKSDIVNMWLDVLQKQRSAFGENHRTYLKSLNNLAVVYFRQQDYNKSQELYMQILDSLNPEEGVTFYSDVVSNIGANYEMMNKCKDAEFYYSQSFEKKRELTREVFSFLSELERESYWQADNFYLEYYQRFSNKYKKDIPFVTVLAYNCELFSKNLLLNSSNQVTQTILNSENQELIKSWRQIKDLRASIQNVDNQLIKDLNLNSSSQIEDAIMNSGNDELVQYWKELIELKRSIGQQEKEIMNSTKAYRNQQQDFKLQWNDIMNALNSDEVSIEFINFYNYDLGNITAIERLYCALILRPGYEYPEMVTLCSEDELTTAFQQSKNIYSLIWKPLEKYLDGAKEIYIAPSGLLHSVSFAGIKPGSGYLGDEYNIHNLLSTKDIIRLKSEESKEITNNKAVLFGGADFGLSNTELSQLDADLKNSSSMNLTRSMFDDMDSSRGQGFDYLPGSMKEVEVIATQLSGLKWETSLYTDKNATETRFKSFSSTNSPKLLHISTHGFYFPQLKQDVNELNFTNTNTENIYRISDNPLIRSGLAFTGANHVWSGKEPDESTDDGILTAYEVSNMNLSNTELVVLSACETGLGDVVGSEGVFGLQRAFRLAGVQSMIVSLWKVPDKETTDLMQEFYTQWINGASKKKALNIAQNKLKKLYPDNPEKWAGFILIE